MTETCPHCKFPIKENAQFCGKCGTKVGMTTASVMTQPSARVAVPQPSHPSPRNGLRRNKWLIAFAASLAVVLVVCLIVSQGMGGLNGRYSNATDPAIEHFDFNASGTFTDTVQGGAPENGWYKVSGDSLIFYYYPTLYGLIHLHLPKQGNWLLSSDHRAFSVGGMRFSR